MIIKEKHKIKISIITVCYNSEKTIAYTLDSVAKQKYKNIEHILIDGGSSDDTLKILEKYKCNKKIIKKKTSIYEAINLAIKNSTGDYLIILNSDDILDDKNTIKKLVSIILKSKKDVYLGNIKYFSKDKFNNINRIYTSKNFKPWMFYLGLMPPHPGAVISKNLYNKFNYNTNYKIAADFDFFLNILKINNINFQCIDLFISRMRTGGISGKNLMSHIYSSHEIRSSLKNRKLFSSKILINLRFLIKLKQFFFQKRKILKYTISNLYKKYLRYDFRIITDVKKIPFNSNFVLSALNLAFLGSYAAKQVKLYKELIHWPDGVYIKEIDPNIKKIAGRELFHKIKIPKKIKQINIYGNLEKKSQIYLEKKFKLPIKIINLPYGKINNIKKKITYFPKKKEFSLITIPTPKQEQLAEFIRSKSKYYQIICIGGTINILSGFEKKVPKILYNYEFIWRLRYESRRRVIRLISTFINYYNAKLLKRTFANLTHKII